MAMLDRFNGLQVLLKVAELGNMSAAARALKMSPTMVTRHIAAQEERLGVRLLHRTTRRVTLTEAGRAYRDAAERIVSELEEAEAAAAANQVTLRGLLRVSAPVSFGTREIAPFLAGFSRLFPELTVDLGLNDRVVDLVDEGWDMAIRIGRLADSTLVARKLARYGMLLCASPAYLAEHGTPTRVVELSRHQCLGYTLSQLVGPDFWSFREDGQIKVPISGHLRTSNCDVLVAAAVAGQGLIYQPTYIVSDAICAGTLVALEVDYPPIAMGGVFAVYPPSSRVPARVRAFIDYMAEQYAGVPPWEKRMGVGLER
ncbi:LysR family transcriptional regulator [Paraburkholderia sp. USG1]|uniref:LysR family transcriptional regulator n=1 Tax=Paraburkholderia sp. USG1 TaxID=2952268 RepID=UPI0028561035|nr:LysR family transcriptional regulator [Paraburkholderia sp. USG1]MDR8398374.1 LysR family transcriptional regulator [Paraburkholderia sp. USG1]